MPGRLAVMVALATLLATGACAGTSSPEATITSPTAAAPMDPGETTPTSTESQSPPPEPEPTMSPSPEPAPLGPSRARLSVSGDIVDRLDLPLAALDSFSATWCDRPRGCAGARSSLQVMGEDFGVPGSHRTSRGLFVTVEVQDRFLYVSGSEHIQGDCTVSFSVADERGYAGKIVCRDITNGTGLGVLTISVRGTFVAAF